MPTLWTIGYEGRALHDVIGLLVASEVELLVDVRLRPQSRKPGLSKTPLSHGLGRERVSYEHRRQLGTPLDIRGLFRAGELEQARRKYREYLLQEAAADLAWLDQQVSEVRTAILCFELRPAECHRSVIAEELAKHGNLRVVHL